VSENCEQATQILREEDTSPINQVQIDFFFPFDKQVQIDLIPRIEITTVTESGFMFMV
jgi:hypothetical protein